MEILIFSILVKNCFRFLFTLETNCVTPCRTARWRRDFGRDGQVFIITMLIPPAPWLSCCHWTTIEYVYPQIDPNSKSRPRILVMHPPLQTADLSHIHIVTPCRYRRYIRSNSRGYLRISPQTQLTLHLTSSSHLTPVWPIHMCWLWMINLLNAHW